MYTVQNENNIVLTIEDNGIGIVNKDVNRVFEKGFTGDNGRKLGKSTGIGLYLCKKLCDQLGLGLSLTSKIDEGTKVSIIFPLGKVNLMS
ncbi:Sensor histidine kinase GraS [bioreactor metagenome]|uniref:histidine kinase n=1 Tax=bioreactor metagenome TaxID=1076179 RepID=A0A645C8Z8_9ZZZZ